MAWVTADAILTQSGAATDPASASPADREWAELCAAAVSAGIDSRLVGVGVDPVLLGSGRDPVLVVLRLAPDPATDLELAWAALLAGVEAYKRREAAFGLTGYVDLQGAAIRVARDYLESVAPIIARYATVGIA